MNNEDCYYRVVTDLWDTPIPDHLAYGYESGRDFRHALWQLVGRWKGRVGERIDGRHGFLLLRFCDTPGGVPDEAWIPECLVQPAPPPECGPEWPADDGAGGELDRAFGFD